jgi:DNA-directed RNA polymerase subunit alpha
VSPEDAVAVAAELVRKHLSYLLYFGKDGMPQETPAGAILHVRRDWPDLLEKTIEELGELSVRSRNSLQKESIFTLGELVKRTESEMLKIENFGKKSLQEIQDFLATHNLRFGMQIESGDDGQLFLMDEAGAGQVAASDED